MVHRSLRRWTDRVCFAVVAVFVLAIGFVQGGITVRLPLVVVGLGSVAVLNASIACLSFCAMLLASSTVFFSEISRERGRGISPPSGPPVAAIVPTYGDAGALHRSVETLLACEYEDLQVYVVCEPGDDETLDAAASLAERGRVTRLVNDRDPGSKAAAVNYAVDATAAPYIGVFDADERVHPAFVAAAVDSLDTHEIVQGRTYPRPDGLLESVTYYESIVLGYLTHRLISLVTGFNMVASNAVVMRRPTYERVGGYDPGMLTEDFDFAFRCYEAGVTVRESFAYPSEIEGAHTVRDWWGQRKRWMTGYAQVFHRRLSGLSNVTKPRAVVSTAFCGGALLGNFALLSLVSQVAVVARTGAPWVLAATIASIYGVVLTARLLDVRCGNVESVGFGWVLVPVTLPFYSLAAIKGIFEYLISWEGEWYRVEKEG